MQPDEAMSEEQPGWTQRPPILAAIGLAAGLLVHFIVGRDFATFSTWQAVSLTAVVLAAGLTGFTIERRRWWASVAFSLGVAAVGALVVAWNGSPEDWSVGEGWRMVSLLLAVAIAAPLFQAARDEGARRFPYASVHDHAWTNVVLFAACCVFVGIVFALSWLLAVLFGLIKIDFLKDLLQKEWFWRALIGVSFGAALGLLREHDGVVRLLQRVVAMVLAVLAPVLAVGLILFVLALPFTGLDALWEATSATTPIMLFCVVGALILANAVIGNAPDQERRSPLLRYGAMGLAPVMLPLAGLAAIAIGLRIGQYGFTPERLWAVVFIAIACLWGAAYLFALVRGRRDWTARIGPMNLTLAFVVCGVALLLATPLVSFNAISTHDQVARFESGRTPLDRFDWRALAFDFGEPGKEALKRLQASSNPAIRTKAIEVAKAETRSDIIETEQGNKRKAELATNLRILPAGTPLPEGLRDAMVEDYICSANSRCTLLVTGNEAIRIRDTCFSGPYGGSRMPTSWDCPVERYALVDGKWSRPAGAKPVAKNDPGLAAVRAAFDAGRIEVRPVQRRQAFVGGVPVGDAFE